MSGQILPTKTIQDIREDLNLCYDPVTGLTEDGYRINDGYLPEDWEGNALDILKLTEWSWEDRLTLVIRDSWIGSNKILHLWAIWCARQALILSDETDPLSIEACNVAERFVNGEATLDELHNAREAVKAADTENPWVEDWVAAIKATQAATSEVYPIPDRLSIIRAKGNAREAAWAITQESGEQAARAAAWAADTAEDRNAQIEKLIEMLEETDAILELQTMQRGYIIPITDPSAKNKKISERGAGWPQPSN